MANILYTYPNVQNILFGDDDEDSVRIRYIDKQDNPRDVTFTNVLPLIEDYGSLDGKIISDKDEYKGFLTFKEDSIPSEINEFLSRTLRPKYTRFPITNIKKINNLGVDVYEIKYGDKIDYPIDDVINELILFNVVPLSDTSESDNVYDNDLRERLVNEIIENPQDPKLILSMSFFDENSSTSANLKEELGSDEAFDLLKDILTELAGEKPKKKKKKEKKKKTKIETKVETKIETPIEEVEEIDIESIDIDDIDF